MVCVEMVVTEVLLDVHGLDALRGRLDGRDDLVDTLSLSGGRCGELVCVWLDERALSRTEASLDHSWAMVVWRGEGVAGRGEAEAVL